MKHRLLYLIASGSIALNSQFTPIAASPLVSIGDNADIFFNGSSSLRWTSNVFRNEDDEVSDLIWTLSPGFELNVGRGRSNADLTVITRYDIVRYQDESQLDAELFHVKAIGSYRSSRLDLRASANFDEQKSNSGSNNARNDLIESDNYGASLNAEYRLSPKFSFSTGIRYTQKEYVNEFADQFADRDQVRVPFDVFYELTPKVDLSLGYAYTTTEVGDTTRSALSINPVFPFNLQNTVTHVGSYDQVGHFFNVGARGNLLPKLTGFFKVGYRLRDSDDSTITSSVFNLAVPGPPVVSTRSSNREDTGMLGLDADLTWATTPKLTVKLGLSRDFGVGGDGQATENSSVDLEASYSISSHFAASGNIGYTLRDYTNSGREDDQYSAGLRLSYSPDQYWRFSLGYGYSENDSSDRLQSYENHSADLTATLRY